MYPINKQQLHSLIHEVVSTYVWQFLAKILNYDRQTQKPDFTAQWENLSQALSADVAKDLSHYFTITTAHEAQHRLDDILALVSNELANRTAVSDTDRRIGLNEAWDTWHQMMEDDNWGKEEEQDYSGGWTQKHEDSPCRVEYCTHDHDGNEEWNPIPAPHYQAEQPTRAAALEEYGRFRDMYPGIDSKYVRVISLLD